MCVHPEALSRVKNFGPAFGNKYHDCDYRSDHRLPSKAQWVIRNSSYYQPVARENLAVESDDA